MEYKISTNVYISYKIKTNPNTEIPNVFYSTLLMCKETFNIQLKNFITF